MRAGSMRGNNIVSVYERSDEVLRRLEQSTNQNVENEMKRLGSATGLDMAVSNFFYDSSRMGDTVVFPDSVARNWLEVNYLYATHFYPGGLPGVGETGADIKAVEGQKYMTVRVGLLNSVQRTLHLFRDVEREYSAWTEKRADVYRDISKIFEGLKDNEAYKALPDDFRQNAWNPLSGTPARYFYDFVESLDETAHGPEVSEAIRSIKRTASELSRHDFGHVEEKFTDIRKGHKGVPHIEDGMIYINTPAASGGICLHSHPGHHDPLNAILSGNDLSILAAQSGVLFGGSYAAGFVGGGETQGEVYVTHIPRKHFFDEIQELVQRSADMLREQMERAGGKPEETFGALNKGVHPIKLSVLELRAGELMNDEILGFRFHYTGTQKGERVLVVSPVITRKEFDKNRRFFNRRKIKTHDMPLSGTLISDGQRGYPFNSALD